MSESVIWKYPLLRQEVNDCSAPLSARPLAFQFQRGVPTVWMVVNPREPTMPLQFHMVATGELFDPDGMQYVGTAQEDRGYVWHLWMKR